MSAVSASTSFVRQAASLSYIAISSLILRFALDRIDHADDGGIDRRAWAAGRRRRRGPAFANDNNRVASPGVDRVESEEFVAGVRPIGIDGADHHDPAPFIAVVFLSGYDVANDPSENHELFESRL